MGGWREREWRRERDGKEEGGGRVACRRIGGRGRAVEELWWALIRLGLL